MTYKYILLVFGEIEIISKIKDVTINCPNEYGGVGNIECIPVMEDIWTGDIHIYIEGKFKTQFSNLTKVGVIEEYLNEDLAWTEVFTYTDWKFNYKTWFNLAKKLKQLIEEEKK